VGHGRSRGGLLDYMSKVLRALMDQLLVSIDLGEIEFA
jgi:hypothetical protein